MKKRILYALVLVTTLSSAIAQDTINDYLPPSNYFTDAPWPKMDVAGPMNWAGVACGDEIAYFRQTTRDSLTVYGIAASLSTLPLLYPDYFYSDDHAVQGWWADYIDTTYTNVYDYLRLYEADPDTPRRVGEDLKVHITVTPVSYYIKPDVTPISYLNPLPVFPMYECYFSTPVTVADSFYVGRTVRTGKPAPGNRKENFEIILFGLDILDQKKESYVLHQDMSMGSVHCQDPEYYEWCYVKNDAIGYPFIFPILTPNPDTTDNGRDTIVGGDTTRVDPDTLGIQSPELLKRYTSVQPNPATETAKVISSFGLTRIEAFNSAGDRVYDAPHTGLTATLDVSRWPAGTYILRLHTPAGTVGKKLIVRR